MSKPKVIIIDPGENPALRCYDIEAGYSWMVIQDLIDKALEDNS